LAITLISLPTSPEMVRFQDGTSSCNPATHAGVMPCDHDATGNGKRGKFALPRPDGDGVTAATHFGASKAHNNRPRSHMRQAINFPLMKEPQLP